MAILIPNMEMPENCEDCPCIYVAEETEQDYCLADKQYRDISLLWVHRPEWCPLVAVPVRMTPDLAMLEAAGMEL